MPTSEPGSPSPAIPSGQFESGLAPGPPARGPQQSHHGDEITFLSELYYSIPLGGARSTNAVWTYESPYAAVAAIRNYLAFYPDRVDAIDERPAG